MNERMKLWLDGELKTYEATMQEFQKKVNKIGYMMMALCVVGMMLLGFIVALSVGENILMVFRVHLPIGCVLGLIVWFCFWCQSRSGKMKKIRDACEKDVAEFFKSGEDQEAFLAQMESNNYGRISYMDFVNTIYDKAPTQFTAGADYFMILGRYGMTFIRVTDIKSIYAEEVTSRVRYNVGGTRVSQNTTAGISLIMEYKQEALARLGRKPGEYTNLFLHNMKQVNETRALIKKYCPTSDEFM